MTVTINQLSHTVNRYATMYHLHTELEELSESMLAITYIDKTTQFKFKQIIDYLDAPTDESIIRRVQFDVDKAMLLWKQTKHIIKDLITLFPSVLKQPIMVFDSYRNELTRQWIEIHNFRFQVKEEDKDMHNKVELILTDSRLIAVTRTVEHPGVAGSPIHYEQERINLDSIKSKKVIEGLVYSVLLRDLDYLNKLEFGDIIH